MFSQHTQYVKTIILYNTFNYSFVQQEESTFQELQWTGLYAAVSKFKQCMQELCADHMGRLVQQGEWEM